MMNDLTRIKIELLCQGLILEPETLSRFPGYLYKRASLSEGVCLKLYSPSGSVIPVNVAVHEAFVSQSPFSFNETDGKIYKGKDPVVSATIVDHPSWYQRQLPDGIRFQEIFQIHYERILATSLTSFCTFKQQGKGCKFCALGSDMSQQRFKKPAHIIRVMEELNALGIPYEEVNLNSGALLDEEEGISKFLEVLNAVRSVSQVPVYAQICPPRNIHLLEELQSAGVTTISFNLEIYDTERRREVMPAKSQNERDSYLQVLEYAVELFGPNQVSSWLIAGLEPPESTIAGIYAIAETGAIPFVTVFRPLTGSEYEGEPAPDPEYLFSVFEVLKEVLHTSSLDPYASRGGCVHCNCCSVLTEVHSGLEIGPMS